MINSTSERNFREISGRRHGNRKCVKRWKSLSAFKTLSRPHSSSSGNTLVVAEPSNNVHSHDCCRMLGCFPGVRQAIKPTQTPIALYIYISLHVVAQVVGRLSPRLGMPVMNTFRITPAFRLPHSSTNVT
ncbi:hypothetical protein LSH36_487g05048 [Paralvinella palmiformis]|uniref:Uncharacterized protein n=1 Tax=Paralvinella palmiformis TaxID=53620 RepID=A0AAD9JA55_9ANNE|nr:hypothetical protein LSH36_487g05048 [Paralvinella palmiformis]